jgi:hypothetical protein
MSIFRNISRVLGGKVGRSLFDKLSRSRSELDPYRVKGKDDPGYTAPVVEQEDVQPGTSTVAGSLPSIGFDRRLAGYTKPGAGVYEQTSDYVPMSLRPKQFDGFNRQFVTFGTKFADGTESTKANQADRGITRIGNSQYERSFDNRNINQTNVPPPPSSLVQSFSEPAKQSANQIFGDLFARQNAVGAPMMFKINK